MRQLAVLVKDSTNASKEEVLDKALFLLEFFLNFTIEEIP